MTYLQGKSNFTEKSIHYPAIQKMEETEKTSGNNMNNIHLYLSKRHRLFYGYSLLDLYQDESHYIPLASAYSHGLLVHKAFVLFCATYK